MNKIIYTFILLNVFFVFTSYGCSTNSDYLTPSYSAAVLANDSTVEITRRQLVLGRGESTSYDTVSTVRVLERVHNYYRSHQDVFFAEVYYPYQDNELPDSTFEGLYIIRKMIKGQEYQVGDTIQVQHRIPEHSCGHTVFHKNIPYNETWILMADGIPFINEDFVVQFGLTKRGRNTMVQSSWYKFLTFPLSDFEHGLDLVALHDSLKVRDYNAFPLKTVSIRSLYRWKQKEFNNIYENGRIQYRYRNRKLQLNGSQGVK